MLISRIFIVLGVMIPITKAAFGLAPGDPQKGKQVFNQCRACHSLKEGKNGIGPSLHGIFGEKAGTVPGYNFSRAMKSSDVLWNNSTLQKYLTNPQRFIPGNKMPFPGIKDQAQLQNLIAYLKQATK